MEVEIVSNGPYLKYVVHFLPDNEKSKQQVEFDFHHTFHSFKRASQRGILGDKIIAVLQYGESYFKQGLIYYVLGEDNIPDSLKKQSAQLQNTVVVVTGDTNIVVTCYRSKNPFKHIKMKTKRLSKYIERAA